MDNGAARFVLAILVSLLVFAGLMLCMLVRKSAADELMPRGLGHPNGPIHWYESGCCSQQDCEPVEQGAITLTGKGYRVRYLTSRGFIAEGLVPIGSSQVRQSRDSDEHACATTARILCIYIHMGV